MLSVDRNDTVGVKFLLVRHPGGAIKLAAPARLRSVEQRERQSQQLARGAAEGQRQVREFVIRSQPQRLSAPTHISKIRRCFRHYAALFLHNPHLGTRKWN